MKIFIGWMAIVGPIMLLVIIGQVFKDLLGPLGQFFMGIFFGEISYFFYTSLTLDRE